MKNGEIKFPLPKELADKILKNFREERPREIWEQTCEEVYDEEIEIVGGSNLDKAVRKFGYKNYGDYLSSGKWGKFKQKYKESGRPQHCIYCNSTKYHLHHVTYENICREKLDDVIPLCSSCHKKEHGE
jgi:hypothetical protein